MEAALAVLDRAVGACRSASVWTLPDAALVESLDAVDIALRRLSAVRLSLVREIDGRGVALGAGAAGTTAWLRDRYRMSGGAARQLTGLAKALDAQLPGTARALADGEVNVEQAQVIAASVADLPVQLRAAGEAHLVEQAGVFGPRELGILGQRVYEVVDPEGAQARELAALERAERRAYRDRCLYLTDVPGTSQVRLTGWLHREAAAIVRAALDPLCAPRSHPPGTTPAGANPHGTTPTDADPTDADPTDATGRAGLAPGPAVTVGEGRDAPMAGQRRADAFVEVCRLATASTDLPEHGGQRPHLVVTLNLDALRRDIGAATLDDGATLSATTARRLACDAAIIPAVLNGTGQILDLGRQRRLITGTLRRALILRDNGCSFPACDRPPRWCEGHHITHWANGGPTNLDNAVLLCGHHHRLIHHSDWTVQINPRDGKPEFTPPLHLDPQQRPQRNQYHRRQ
ncbi:MAG TPA: DUF222 domain-containing protein [Micromonosporaceae bacterium]|nr:DUF222 domain-containing protein [Micromonosporaceae bacterium]